VEGIGDIQHAEIERRKERVRRVWPGYITIATMFGLQAYWSDNPNQPPGVADHPIREKDQVYDLKAPDRDSGLMSFNLRRLKFIAEHLPVEAVGIPIVRLTESWSDQEIREQYHGLLDIAERHAREIYWHSCP
jgi:hypothetical protein